MTTLKVRSHVHDYRRDSYLGNGVNLNPEFQPIDCAIGYSQWGISPRVAIAHQDFDPHCVSAYPEPNHETLLKPSLLKRFSRAALKEEQIFLGHGSFNLIERLIHKLIQPGHMLGVGPQFNEIPSEFVASSGTYHPVPISISDPKFPLPQIVDQLNTGNYSVLYLDNPNNPLGSLIDLDTISYVVQVAERHGTIVIVDEAYGDFVPDSHSSAYLVNNFTNLVTVRSCSKALGLAAERIGYMFLSSALGKLYSQLDVPFEPSVYAAHLARATLSDQQFIQSIRQQVADVKSKLITMLQDAGFTIMPTHQTVSIMSIHRPDHNVAQDLASVGVKVEAGSCFCQTHQAWDDSFGRVRVVSPELLDELVGRLQLLPLQT